jgi:antitoxin component YwqK of YwqJK toxin-antitoxin module
MTILKLFVLAGCFTLSTGIITQAQNVTDSKGLKQGAWKKSDAAGNLIYEGQFKDNIPQGTFLYYYEDGKVRSQLAYSADGKSASAVNFHPNGKKMAEGTYLETKKDGLWKYYNDLETLSSEETYTKGIPTGVWKTYFDDGKLLEECPYSKGKKDGECRQYFQDGSIKSVVNFKDGKYDGSARYFYPNGKPILEGQFVNDLREGLWTAYKDNGEKESEITYFEGSVSEEKYYDKAREEELNNEVKAIPE